MILAVFEARCDLSFSSHDVYLNVAGGMRVTEPAADLAVAAALVSSLSEVPFPPRAIIFGEIGLSGEIRAVAHGDSRLKEAVKLGFSEAITPNLSSKNENQNQFTSNQGKLIVTEIANLNQLLGLLRTKSSQSQTLNTNN